MGGADRSAGAFSPEALAGALAALPAAGRYRVALSGGADSLALLHGLASLPGRLAPARIDAVHVHHGLHPQADRWAEFCRGICADLDLALEVLRIDARPAPGESPEAAARRARYDALASILAPGDALCTAHHQRDQAETLLLQLLRGAGPAGLAAMPAHGPLGAGLLLRPLLGFRAEALRDYLVAAGLDWVEDPGNRDRRFDRNYLRHEVLPLLEARWPGAPRTLARAAGHQADALAIADALAEADLAGALDPAGGTLSCPVLASLPGPRARNLLRHWLNRRGLPPPGAAHVRAILEELLSARADATPLVRWPGAEVRRHRDALHALAPLPCHDRSRVLAWRPGEPLALPHGALEATASEGRGLSAARCAEAAVEIRFRRGGERFRPAGRRHSTTLKRLLQTTALPPWLRERVPLVYLDGELAAVAGIWVAAGHAAQAGEKGWLLRWTALPPAA